MVLSVFGARLVQLQGVDPGSYAAMAAAEGTVQVVLPAGPRRHPRSQRRTARGLGRRADGGRRPGADPRTTQPRSPGSSPSGSTSTTSTPWPGSGRRGQPLPVRRPPRPSDARDRRADRGRGPRHRGPLDRARPAAHLPGRGRGRQPGRLRGHRRVVRRLRAGLRPPAVRHRRHGRLRGRRRQPDPVGPEHPSRRGGRDRPHHHDRPGPAVVHPAGPPQAVEQAGASPGWP